MTRPFPTRHAAAFAAVLAAAVLAGCSSPLEKPYPEKHFVVVDATRPVAAPPPPGGAVVAVRRFRVSPGFDGRELVYRTDAVSYRSDFYNAYFVAPGPMLTAATAEWLGRSGLFRVVVQDASQVDPRYALEGAVTALYADTAGPPSAVLEMQFLLLEVKARDPRIVLKRDYSERVPAAGVGADAVATAQSAALARILTRLEADLRAALAGG